MSVNYLHGVETVVVNRGPVAVNVVKTAVVALLGISPFGPKQSLTIVQSEDDAAQFGFFHPSNSIATALRAIRSQGGAFVVVVNVFDEDDHTDAVTETHTVNRNRLRLDGLLGKDTIEVVKLGTPNVTLAPGTDYEFDADTQTVTILNVGDYPDGTSLEVSYLQVNLDLVSSSDVIGGVSAGVRTGMALYEECYQEIGVTPKILCVPYFNEVSTVAGEMLTRAEAFKAIALFDAPEDVLPSEVLSGRGGTAGVVKNFFTGSKRAYLLYPRMMFEDLYASQGGIQTVMLMPYSAIMAGIIARVDAENGYWFSPSNKEIFGIIRPERNITFQVNSPNTEANLLNENGVTTVARTRGAGFRTWGNRSASHPTNTRPDNFISVQRVMDILHESLELAMLQFIDQPLTPAIIDAIKETGNAFMRVLVSRSALIDGRMSFDPAKNPPLELAAGRLRLDIEALPPSPAERITFESFINPELIRGLLT
jgi:phage tail sheath protein FI